MLFTYYVHAHSTSFIIMQWLEGECLEYFSSWETYALKEPVSKAQKSRMMLSRETMNGIFMTGIVKL